MTDSVAFPWEDLLRDLAPQVLGAVVRRYGDFAAAEDAVQEALVAATLQWPKDGLPDNPRGWLIHVALRRMSDHHRAELARKRREFIVVSMVPEPPRLDPPSLGAFTSCDGEASPADLASQDDTLVLLFMCCHPALTSPSAIALTLRAVGGLTTTEIARAYLVPEATMAQRISRAKQKIKTSGVPFELPDTAERNQRLGAVLHVLYLIFNEGYASSGGATLQRRDLAVEAIRLTRAVHALLPNEAEVAGLLALMLLTDARRHARTGPQGELIPLDEQDRSLWNRDEIAVGTALVSAALSRGAAGPYQLQAAIAALHDEAPTAADTDWPQILALYGVLKRMADNPVVALNDAIATAMVHGPSAGLELLNALDADERIAGHYRLDAVRGHLLEKLGDRTSAVRHYLVAAGKTASVPERDYLTLKAARLGDAR